MNNKVIFVEETDSTSSLLKRIASEKLPEEGTVVMTNFQTSGKGQRGNSWESAPGKNLTFSIILYPYFVEAGKPFIISQLTALAIKSVLDKYASDVKIKWPNDIYWKDKKICGTLVENDIMGNSVSQSVIGIGININQEIFVSNAPNPVSLKQITGNDYDINSILNEVISNLLSLYDLSKKTPDAVIARYKQALYRNTGFHTFNDSEGNFLAEIYDIDPSGLLILKTSDGDLRKYAFKEVRYVFV